MGIQALPETTVRVLGASQVLTDPAALVKELVDNALDANATSIAIEIHPNTLDLIQVRDNGHGIVPEDRPLVARRYCTSKITHDSDLKHIGGSSLGFRGEALASAAELSASLSISTRIEGEQVGVALKIDPNGEVVAQDKASTPVGTTVRVTDFIKAHPVRRQVVLKNTEACLKKIKRTLQAYALARRHVRFSLRILKAKNKKLDWVYASKVNSNIEDAAIKVVGIACASQCMCAMLEANGFVLHAFLPRPDADPAKISHLGAFISVDARPVSSSRGFGKQMAKLFRETLKRTADGYDNVKDPFIFLDITCPSASYDPNLEPAKDDVLFEDCNLVIDTAKNLFTDIYTCTPPSGPRETTLPPMEQLFQARTEGAVLPSDSDQVRTVAAVAPSGSIQSDSPHRPNPGNEAVNEDERLPRRRTVRSNMYGCDEEDVETLTTCTCTGRNEADSEELRLANLDVTLSNPWILAKMNASNKTPTPRQGTLHTQISSAANFPSSPTRAAFRLGSTNLPTPRPSSPLLELEPCHSSYRVPANHPTRDNVVRESGLPLPQPYTPLSSHGVLLSSSISSQGNNEAPLRPRDPIFNSRSPSSGTPLDAIPDVGDRPRRSPRKQAQRGQVNKPFVPPTVKRPEWDNVWFDHLQDVERPRLQPRVRRTQHSSSDGVVVQGEPGELIDEAHPLTPVRRNRDIRDFVGHGREGRLTTIVQDEGRSSAHTSRREPIEAGESETLDLTGDVENTELPPPHRGFKPASELIGLPEPPDKQPPKRRKTSERRALEALSANAPLTTSAPEDEYQPSRRKSSRQKPGRTKSSLLPLERIPAGQGTHQLLLPVSRSLHDVAAHTHRIDSDLTLFGLDESSFPAAHGFDAVSKHLLSLTASVHDLLVGAGGGGVEDVGPEMLLREVKVAFAKWREGGEDV
jgi:DNA mismatch repair protein MutL